MQLNKLFMRKIACTIVLMAMFSSAFSQAKNKSRFEIKTNLLNLIAGGPSAGLEYSLQKDWGIMLSAASGRIDYGDFGGVTRYKTTTLECRKYFSDQLLFIGPYIKNIEKQVSWQESVVGGTIPFSVGKNRDFIGNGFSAGATSGIKFPLSGNLNLELNSQLGYGRYYKMADKNNNLPSGNYLDARIGLWFGFRF
jgi:hypothetical protein